MVEHELGKGRWAAWATRFWEQYASGCNRRRASRCGCTAARAPSLHSSSSSRSIAGGSSLPIGVQVLLGLITLGPWIPGIPQKWMSWGFVLMSTVPTLAFTWTGGSPLMFGVLALSAARVAISSSLPASISYGLFATMIVIGRQFVVHHHFDWVLWKTYIELGLALGWAARSRVLLIVRSRQAREEHALARSVGGAAAHRARCARRPRAHVDDLDGAAEQRALDPARRPGSDG